MFIRIRDKRRKKSSRYIHPDESHRFWKIILDRPFFRRALYGVSACTNTCLITDGFRRRVRIAYLTNTRTALRPVVHYNVRYCGDAVHNGVCFESHNILYIYHSWADVVQSHLNLQHVRADTSRYNFQFVIRYFSVFFFFILITSAKDRSGCKRACFVTLYIYMRSESKKRFTEISNYSFGKSHVEKGLRRNGIVQTVIAH